jgi:hypothetical protein
MRTAFILALLIAVLCVGCATHTVSVRTLMPLQSESSYHPLFYAGSDEHYHYFEWLRVWYWVHYRVARSELSLPRTFTRDSGQSEVMWPGTLEKAVTK